VTLAVPWLKIDAALVGLPDWGGRILIDATNPFVSDGELADLGDQGASELVARRTPGARVVKALNHLYVSNFAGGPRVGGGKRVTFVSGDDADAKAQVRSLLEAFGFAVIDLGSLRDGGRLQQAGGPLGGPDLVQMPD
jgi:predicted dinucleotide-binding enzyme